MKINLTLGLADRPGQLLKALEPIAKNGGNIISILHERETIRGSYVPVILVVDFLSQDSFEKAIKELNNERISIIKSEQIIEKANLTFIIIGKIDVKKIVEVKVPGAKIIDLEVLTSSKENCVKLNVETPVRAIDKVVDRFEKIAEKESAILISSV
jgi:ACT domain-containing protein